MLIHLSFFSHLEVCSWTQQNDQRRIVFRHTERKTRIEILDSVLNVLNNNDNRDELSKV